MAHPLTYPTLPTTLPADVNVIRGAGRLYWSAWVTAGGAGTYTSGYMGQVADGGIDWDPQIEYGEIEGEESLCASDAYVIGEKHTIKCTLLEAPIATVNMVLYGNASNVATNAGETPDNKSMAIGGVYNAAGGVNPTFRQICLETPAEYNSTPASPLVSLKSALTFWKCLVKPAGAIKYSRKGIASLPIEIQAFWDHTVTSPALSSYGKIGIKVTNIA